MPQAPATAPTLERRLGPLDAAAIVVSNVIGGGILFTPPLVAAAVPASGLFLLALAAGGALAFAGAMAYAELAALRPRAGGEYVYLRAAFGPLAAFLTGWTSFVAGFSGAIAASAFFLARTLGRFIPAAGDATPLARPSRCRRAARRVSPQTHRRAARRLADVVDPPPRRRPGRLVGNIAGGAQGLGAAGVHRRRLAFGTGSMAQLRRRRDASARGWLLALMPVMFTYSGWNAAAYVAEEMRDPGPQRAAGARARHARRDRDLPAAERCSTCTCSRWTSWPRCAAASLDVDRRPAARHRRRQHHGRRSSIISLAASISAMILAGPRVYYAMARDGMFFPAAAPRPSAVPHAGHGDRGAGGVERRARR